MILEKDGISYDVVHPSEVARLKGAGYKEVKPEVEPVTDPAPKKPSGSHSKKEVKPEVGLVKGGE